MSQRKFFSVVYEVVDEAAFQQTVTNFTESMINDTVVAGTKVSACGWGDYATAHDALLTQIQHNGMDADDVLAVYLHEVEGVAYGEKMDARLQEING